MSAPPRSTVTLPRLATDAVAPSTPSGDAPAGAGHRGPTRQNVPVGPGGGRLLSNALCLCRIELPTALCAHLRLGRASPLLTAPLGLARALVASARQVGQASASEDLGQAARREFDRVLELPEGDLVQELTTRLESLPWPAWVPPVAFAMPLGHDIATSIGGEDPPAAPEGVACPLLAARLVSAIRQPVFLRDAAPSLANLLNLFRGPTPSGTWEIWRPVAPGRAQPLPFTNPSPPGVHS